MSLRSAGLLGMNRRNACYTLARNPRSLYPLVDDKLKTKELLDQNQIPVPELYFSIRRNFELKALRGIKLLKEFVLKPARGAEGRGILVFIDQAGGRRQNVGGRWKRSNGELLSMGDIEYHTANILAGLYSLGGVDDQALIEYRVRSHEIFRRVAYQGVPDIRVILYRGVPVMSMLRLPTAESDGRANLHQGAVGVGIDLLEGVTLGGVHHDRLIDVHPDLNTAIQGIRIPFWNDILETAVRTFEVFRLGYFGIDFVIDHLLGPLVLELNARPGLNIQLANREGLLGRLKRVDSYGDLIELMTPGERLELSARILTGT